MKNNNLVLKCPVKYTSKKIKDYDVNLSDKVGIIFYAAVDSDIACTLGELFCCVFFEAMLLFKTTLHYHAELMSNQKELCRKDRIT